MQKRLCVSGLYSSVHTYQLQRMSILTANVSVKSQKNNIAEHSVLFYKLSLFHFYLLVAVDGYFKSGKSEVLCPPIDG